MRQQAWRCPPSAQTQGSQGCVWIDLHRLTSSCVAAAAAAASPPGAAVREQTGARACFCSRPSTRRRRSRCLWPTSTGAGLDYYCLTCCMRAVNIARPTCCSWGTAPGWDAHAHSSGKMASAWSQHACNDLLLLE